MYLYAKHVSCAKYIIELFCEPWVLHGVKTNRTGFHVTVFSFSLTQIQKGIMQLGPACVVAVAQLHRQDRVEGDQTQLHSATVFLRARGCKTSLPASNGSRGNQGDMLGRL